MENKYSINERWLPVEGYKDYYVSNLGRIRGMSGKILKPCPTNGYLYVALKKADGTFQSKTVHRLVAENFIPNDDPIKYCQVNHKDGNKLNNRVENLEWVTPSQNLRHARETGLRKHLVTPEIRQEIRELYANGVSKEEIAKRFNFKPRTITKHVNGIYQVFTTKEKEKEMLRLHQEGVPVTKIAELVNKSVNTVYRHLRKFKSEGA